MTGDFNKMAYISNHPRETSTNQILNVREHTKMEVDIKSSFASLKYVCDAGNSVCLIIFLNFICIANAVQVLMYIK